jgi:hypothetical protein
MSVVYLHEFNIKRYFLYKENLREDLILFIIFNHDHHKAFAILKETGEKKVVIVLS